MTAEQLRVDLVSNVDLLCLDAGNTVIFLDHERLADILREACAFVVDASILVGTEGEAKRLAESNALVDTDWAHKAKPGAPGWGKMVARACRSRTCQRCSARRGRSTRRRTSGAKCRRASAPRSTRFVNVG